MPTFQVILQSLLISLLIQVFFFIIASTNKTNKVTDLSYGLTFILIALISFARSTQNLAHWLLLTMISLWGSSLGWLSVDKNCQDQERLKV